MLNERVVLITGGAEGIGGATALCCAADGARVAILDRNADAGQRVVSEIQSRGNAASFHRCDVTDPVEVEQAVCAAHEIHGALHVLITSAGILQGAFQSVEELTLPTFQRVMEVNLVGTYLCVQAATPLIEASGGGAILCVASGAGVRGPSSSLVYGASKSAVHGFCVTLEQQLAPRGIRVNVVCPGSIDTSMKRQNIRDRAVAHGLDPEATLASTPLGDPMGVARVLAFLASDAADYLVGTLHTR